MRFESRHRQLKSNAVSTSCNINLLKTIATKQMLKMCEMIHTFNVNDHTAKFVFSDKKVTICDVSYRLGTFIVIDMHKSEKQFGKITKIMQIEGEIYFNVTIFEEVTFDEHFHAYIVEQGEEEKLIKQQDVPNIAPCLSIKSKNVHYISTRYGL